MLLFAYASTVIYQHCANTDFKKLEYNLPKAPETTNRHASCMQVRSKGVNAMNIPNHSVYLICSKTGTWLSTLISWCSHLQYAHASISFDESFERLYSFGRTEPDNPFCGGFVIENLYDGVYTKFQDCRCLIYRIPVTALQYEALSKLIERFILEKETYSYNMLGLFGILFNTPIKRVGIFDISIEHISLSLHVVVETDTDKRC